MKILNTAQIRQWDAFTIAQTPLASVDLMEKASMAFARWLTGKFFEPGKINVICGTGNNGGDGLAISRILLGRGYDVDTYIVKSGKKYSSDFRINELRLREIKLPVEITKEEDIPVFLPGQLIVDAIFGSGLSRPIEELPASLIKAMNESRATIVSVDLPSGLSGDTVRLDGIKVKANHTVTFQSPKLSFLLPQNESIVGEWHLLDIGLLPEFEQEVHTHFHYTDKVLAKLFLRKRGKYSHKGTYGHGLLLAGSEGKMGAAILAAKAALRTGCGLLSCSVPRLGIPFMQTAFPEAICLTGQGKNYLSKLPDLSKYQAVAIGPGIGKSSKTAKLLKNLIDKVEVPIVLDADALNLLAENEEWLGKLPKNTVLTPHPKEFERLAGKAANDYERLEQLRVFAKKTGAVVVLKGAYSAVALPTGDVYFNATGNPGMATAGSGDVLTGMILSLLAQGYLPAEAAVFGVYLHGLAGDFAASAQSQEAMIASDIVAQIGKSFQYMR